MKRAFRPWALDCGYWTVKPGPSSILHPLFSCFLLFVTASALAFTSENNNPYTGIVERNVFGIKAPPPPPVATPPPTAATGIELRGILTLLGRPQVLLNFKVPGKPPEPPKDRSLVMDVNQREGEVEVLEINPAAGTVRIRNQGNELSMNLKDNAPKPQGVPGIAAPSMPSPAGMNPGLPAPAAVPAPAGASGVSLPTRQLRSGGGADVGTPNVGGGIGGLTPIPTPQPATAARLEANVALYEANRLKNEELIKAGAKIPRMPVHSLLREAPAQNK